MRLIVVLAFMTAPASSASQTAPPPAASQNPSPMVEETRAHERLAARELAGAARSFPGPGGKSVEILVPDKPRTGPNVDLVIHFHGAAWLPKQAVAALENGSVAAVVSHGLIKERAVPPVEINRAIRRRELFLSDPSRHTMEMDL